MRSRREMACRKCEGKHVPFEPLRCGSTAFKFVFILLIVQNARLGVIYPVVFDHSVKYF